MRVTSEEVDLIESTTGIRLDKIPDKNGRFLLVGSCPFLKNNHCSIYKIRPCQCRIYHCGRLKPTDKRLESLTEVRELMAKNPEYAKARRIMEDEGVEWGNRHGWNWTKLKPMEMR
jgi:Fe-S-cluster containining protein